MSTGRAVSTVGDATLALLLLSAAMVVLVTFVETGERDHDPMETEYTTETLLSSTMNTTYYPERALGEFHGGTVYDETDYERRDLLRGRKLRRRRPRSTGPGSTRSSRPDW
ncbi:hypothetical protein BRC61_01790 [Halobacteriales archaeon QH_10_65_19]|nr:MAG: hypothetical protein BRC61_01790 [Halobacteriales archaeon QH_10_65_19]